MASQNKILQIIESFPESIQSTLKRYWSEIEEHFLKSEWSGECPWPEDFLKDVLTVFSRSDFVAESCIRYPLWLSRWSEDSSELIRSFDEKLLRQQLHEQLDQIEDEATFYRILREFRCLNLVRIVWRDLLQIASLEETLAEMSALADVSVDEALNWLYQQATKRYGVPLAKNSEGLQEPQRMIVLGMGKLGARELNVSSDIDLIFAYPRGGETDHERKPIDNHQFFTRLGQKLIAALDQITEDGFVFRVDMRLRPYGSSGALALNFAAFEDYYQNQGREWERYAMIKSRVIAGDFEKGQDLLEIIRPFVYRRYADFSSFQALREMKKMIMSEVHRKGGDRNIKLGQGGIREIEFIVQACQLIYGGRDSRLQQPGLLPVLAVLKEEYLPPDWVDELAEANHLLRRTEHAIQGLEDKQTQLIPDQALARDRVAWSLGYQDWAGFEAVLSEHRDRVSHIFSEFLHDPEQQEQSSEAVDARWLHLWQADASEDQWHKALEEAGFDDLSLAYEALMELKQSRLFGIMSADAKRRFEQFLPMLLTVITDYPNPGVTLSRVLGFVKVILGRTVYLVLLYENPGALRQLCKLCSESPWIAEHMAKSPVILDELLDAQSLYQPPPKDELQDELRQQMLRIPDDDLEAQMDALRTFRQSHMLRVAAAELSGTLPLMKVSDYLTWLAEVLVEQAIQIAWHNLVSKHGLPEGISGDQGDIGFVAVGYGKFGGIELSYSSDLDMVFIYDAPDGGSTDGQRQINNQLFYTRLGQRIIHILTTQTTQGSLYDADMRLRPSGNSGMLVSSLSAFEKYQTEDAWTWEHQALVRARAIAGAPVLADAFTRLRSQILCRSRDKQSLRRDVLEMREKMRQAAIDRLGAETAYNHIKQGVGGLIDIEFVTQYAVLRHAHDHPDLLAWSDNIRLLETLARLECFPNADVSPLIDVYRSLRSAIHRKALADPSYQVSLDDDEVLRERVIKIWNLVFETDS